MKQVNLMSDSAPPLPIRSSVMCRCARAYRTVARGCASSFFLLVGVIEALALDPSRSLSQYNTRTWRRVDQLPSNLVSAVAQTPDGRLLIGTSRGLVDFDGLEFRTPGLRGPSDMASRVITVITPRTAGGLWVGTERGGCGIWDGRTFTPLADSLTTQRNSTVTCLEETRDGSLIIGTPGSLIRRPAAGPEEELATGFEILSVHEDATGRLWVGTTDRGLLCWQQGRLAPVEGAAAALWGKHPIQDIVVDRDGIIWVAAGNGLHSLDANLAPRPAPTLAVPLSRLLLDRHDTLWIGSMFDGLYRLRDGRISNLPRRDGLASDHVLSLAESSDGSLWVGTEDGLTQFFEVKFPIFSVQEGLAAPASLSLAAAPDGGVWIGTNDGLSLLAQDHIDNWGQNRRDGFPSGWIRRLWLARNGDLYVFGGRQELSRFRDRRIERSWNLGHWTQSAAEDDRGIILTEAGRLTRLVGDQFEPYRLPSGEEPTFHSINRILVSRDGSLWIAASPGLAQIRDGVVHRWTPDNAAEDLAFFNLCEDDDGAIWASRNAGLVRVKDGRIAVVDHRQGLHSDSVRTMIADLQGHWWMDSPEGIFRVNRQELSAVADGRLSQLACTVFDGPDFVKSVEKLSGEYAGCRSTDGRIWLTSARGVICIDPAHLPINPLPPALRLHSVRVDGREYPVDREPDLKTGAQNLEFSYGAVDFRAPERVRYRYRLQGYQDEWIDAGTRRTAYFAGLPPGDYTFQVQACNADGVWNVDGAGFHLSLRPELRETLWFRLLVVGAGAGLLILLWSFRDRSRRRELLEIRHRERLQMEMIESSPVAMLMLDHSHRVLYVNAAFTRVFGYTASELPDLATWWRLAWIDPATLASWGTSWEARLNAAAAAARSIEPVETTLAHKDRSLRYTAITSSAVGERTLVICSDLTERKRAEEERLHLEEQLQQGQKMEAIGRLSGGIAHDFNNLLTVILGNISLLELDATYPPEATNSIRDIRNAAKRAANLTSQLLAFSRKQPLQVAEIDLNLIVREMTSMLQRIVGEDVRMEIETPPTPLLTQADPTKIEQVVLNLVLNARDAMPGGGRLRVATSLVDVPLGAVPAVLNARPGRFVRLAVSDTGCGIHPEIRPHIFEPFLTTKEVGKGTGLGLAIVFGIVEQHKGWVDLQSELMQGTTFSIYLPAGIETSGTTPPPSDEPLTERPPSHRRRILLVEDDPGVRAYARKTLVNQGHQVYEAASGLLAMPVWTQHSEQIDILFTDVVMPDGISGLELARHLLQEKPALKVIYTSGYSAEIAGGAFAGRQGVDFLPKPYSPTDLIRVIDRASADLPPP